VPLVLDAEGQRLAKRSQSAGLAPLRAAGATPEGVVGQLAASCGLVDQGTRVSARVLAEQYAGKGYDIMRAAIIYSHSGQG